MEEWG